MNRPPLELSPADLELVFPEPRESLKDHPNRRVSWDQWMDETAARTRAFFRNPSPREPDRSPRERFVLE